MIKIDFQDFYHRKTSVAKLGRKAIPERKDLFLSRVIEFVNQGDKTVINIETTEQYVRVWYREEAE